MRVTARRLFLHSPVSLLIGSTMSALTFCIQPEPVWSRNPMGVLKGVLCMFYFLMTFLSGVPTCFQTATIVPTQKNKTQKRKEKKKKNSAVSSPDNYCPVAVFPIVCFEKLVLQHLNWQQHLPYFITQCLNPHRVLCSAPFCSHCAPMTAFLDKERTLL